MHAITSGNETERRHPAVPVPGRVSHLRAAFHARPIEKVSAGRAVFWEGDPARDVFEVRAGLLRLYRILPDGRRAIVGFIFPGEILGVSFQDKYLFTAEAVDAVSVRRMSRSAFHAAVERSADLRPELLSYLRDEMCAAQDQMLLVMRGSADERVAAFLLHIARQTVGEPRRGTEFCLAMYRSDIADYLGMSLETVSRSLSKLKAQGVITLDGPSRPTVLRPRALRELAGEEGGVIDDELPMGYLAASGRPADRLAC